MGRFFHVSDRGQNNCYFDSAVKNKNMHQNKFLRRRLVLTGTIHGKYSRCVKNKSKISTYTNPKL